MTSAYGKNTHSGPETELLLASDQVIHAEAGPGTD